MKKHNKGFMSLDIIFALFILSIASILMVSVFNNNISYMKTNKEISKLRLESQNFIDEISRKDNNLYLNSLINKDNIVVEKDNITIYVNKEPESSKLWRLNIKSVYKENKNISRNWVIVVENPEN